MLAYMTLSANRSWPLLFLRYAHLTGMISLSLERGLLWLKHEPLPALALHFELIPFLTRSSLLTGESSASFRSLNTTGYDILFPGSLALEAPLRGWCAI